MVSTEQTKDLLKAVVGRCEVERGAFWFNRHSLPIGLLVYPPSFVWALRIER
jgi:hypothetical protein